MHKGILRSVDSLLPKGGCSFASFAVMSSIAFCLFSFVPLSRLRTCRNCISCDIRFFFASSFYCDTASSLLLRIALKKLCCGQVCCALRDFINQCCTNFYASIALFLVIAVLLTASAFFTLKYLQKKRFFSISHYPPPLFFFFRWFRHA